MRNFAQIEGNLGADAITTTTPDNKTVTRFSVAINETWKKNGETKTRTDWVRVSAWGSITDFARKLKKGHTVQVQGKLKMTRYTDRSNVEHQGFEIVAASIRKFDFLRDSADNDMNLGEGSEAAESES
jgi:single-strand DNA-binding protein